MISDTTEEMLVHMGRQDLRESNNPYLDRISEVWAENGGKHADGLTQDLFQSMINRFVGRSVSDPLIDTEGAFDPDACEWWDDHVICPGCEVCRQSSRQSPETITDNWLKFKRFRGCGSSSDCHIYKTIRRDTMNHDVTDAMVKYIGRDDLVGLDDPYLHKLAAIWLEHYDCNGCRRCKALPGAVEVFVGRRNKRKPMDYIIRGILEFHGFLDAPLSEFGIQHDP